MIVSPNLLGAMAPGTRINDVTLLRDGHSALRLDCQLR